MIDVNTVGFDDLLEFVDEGLSGGFDTQNGVDLDHVVAVGFL
jgi:hypothetical protein